MRSTVRYARRAVELLDFGPPINVMQPRNSTRNAASNNYKTVYNILDIKKTLSLSEWKTLKDVCQSHGFGYLASQALLKKDSGLREVKTLMQALQQTNSLNLILKIGMLPSFELYAQECGVEDQKFICDVVDEALCLPALTSEIGIDLIKGLVAVPDWKDRVNLILSKANDIVSLTFTSP